jgi:hypothetical protein
LYWEVVKNNNPKVGRIGTKQITLDVERKGNAAYSFSTREFMRTVSPRDLLTSFSLALLLMACFDITDYYRVDHLGAEVAIHETEVLIYADTLKDFVVRVEPNPYAYEKFKLTPTSLQWLLENLP